MPSTFLSILCDASSSHLDLELYRNQHFRLELYHDCALLVPYQIFDFPLYLVIFFVARNKPFSWFGRVKSMGRGLHTQKRPQELNPVK